MLRKLVPPLGRRAWWLLTGYTIEKIGTGLTAPFLIVYLSDVRGIGLATAGLVLSMISVAGIVAIPLSGWLVDRIGAGRTVVVTLVSSAAGAAGFAMTRQPWVAFASACLFGAGAAGMWNGFVSLVAVAAPPEQRNNVFGVAFALQNLGLGIGAAIGGSVASLTSPGSFVAIFGASAGLYLAFAAMVIALGEAAGGRNGRSGRSAVTAASDRGPSGYRAALSDRALVGVALLNALFAFICTSFRETAFPKWATRIVGASASTGVIGAAFLANNLAVVGAQLFVLRYLLKGHRRTRAVASAALLFGAANLVALWTGRVSGATAGATGLVSALIVLGLGETMLQPSLYAMVNDLAPDSLRGRYNAIFNLAWQIGPAIGPAATGAVLAGGHYEAFFFLIAAICIAAALLAIRLETILPTRAVAGPSQPPEGAPGA